MQTLTTEQDLEAAVSAHPGQPVLVFKHSTQCPISAAAFEQVQQFERSANVPVYLIRVIEERPVSNHFAARYEVTHQSPQAVVLRDGQVIWHASHWDVTADALRAAAR